MTSRAKALLRQARALPIAARADGAAELPALPAGPAEGARAEVRAAAPAGAGRGDTRPGARGADRGSQQGGRAPAHGGIQPGQ